MTRIEIETALHDLNSLVLEGKMLEAFEKYYDDEVVMQENQAAPTVSKVLNREREIEFLGNITEFRGAEILSLAIGEGISYITWKYDYTHKQWGVKDYSQISVQYWKNGKIVREHFVYGN